MHAAELMARLNPSTVRYDIGRGGIPELTPQDIAAAIAMVPAGLGRELMCRLWWPAGAALTAPQLDRALTDLLLREWTERELGMYKALGALAGAVTASERAVAQRRYAEAHARRWPKWIERLEPVTITETYEHLREAVLHELAEPRRCPACGGTGEASVRMGKVPCERCLGQGTTKQGPTWRAAMLDMKETSYKQTWHEPYEWLLATVVELATGAADELKKRIRRE